MLDEVTTLATCLYISLVDKSVIAMTDYDQSLIIDNVTYYPNKSFSYSKLSYSSSVDVDKINIESVLSSDVIIEEDILSRRYDGAQVKIFCVDYRSTKRDKIILKRGEINRIRLIDGKFIADISSIKEKNQELSEIFSPLCRAQFCDIRCKLNPRDFTSDGVVSEVLSTHRRFVDHSLQKKKKNYYKNGVVTFVSGKNKSITVAVKENTAGLVELLFATPYKIEVSDRYTITAGCNKLFSTCGIKFNNVINFRGEPHIIGSEKTLQSIQSEV